MDIRQIPIYDIKPSFAKAQFIKRQNILVVSLLQENGNSSNIVDFIKTLNANYSYITGDVAPYHYYVDIDGVIYSSKQDILSLVPTSELQGFSDDIIIMIMNRDITLMPDVQKDALTELIANIANNYVIETDKVLFHPEEYVSGANASTIVNQMLKDIITKKSTTNTLNFIVEDADSGAAVTSQNVGAVKADENCFTFRDFFFRFGADETTLRSMNPHITNEIQPGQIVFYPKNIITDSLDKSELLKKNADKYYKLCEIQVEE
jgi:hypothetical protein